MSYIFSRPIIQTAAFLSLIVGFVEPAMAWHSLVDRVKDGPAAHSIRESYRLLEEGEASENDKAKLELYARGKDLAEQAVAADQGNAEAHFALFANWGRWLQVDGWFKNSYRLPALWVELNRTLELDPQHPDALAAKGGLFLELPGFLGGDAAKAQGYLEQAIKLDPDSVGARLELAECYMLEDRRDDARGLVVIARRIASEQDKKHYIRRADALLVKLGGAPPPQEAGL
jgi:tetratricopeptide (TPR) repeat protein